MVTGGKLYEVQSMALASSRRRRASHGESTHFAARPNLKFLGGFIS
jgi:hypothetical protein